MMRQEIVRALRMPLPPVVMTPTPNLDLNLLDLQASTLGIVALIANQVDTRGTMISLPWKSSDVQANTEPWLSEMKVVDPTVWFLL